tara:strand:- start:1153 stop:1860 length:708 start_codon:yes stop_codon:yes gene_type:complete
MNFLAIVQARMGSTRLPGKVMKEIMGVPSIKYLLDRLSRSTKLNEIIVATSSEKANRPLIEYLEEIGYKVFVGSEDNVLERYYLASANYKNHNIIRITGDCPLVDPLLLDKMIDHYVANDADYLSNIWPRSFPKGLDIEIFSYHSLNRAYHETSDKYDLEHVTPYIRESGKFNVANYLNKNDYSNQRWTVDWPEDFELIKEIFEYFTPEIFFSWEEIISLYQDKPEIFKINKHLD